MCRHAGAQAAVTREHGIGGNREVLGILEVAQSQDVPVLSRALLTKLLQALLVRASCPCPDPRPAAAGCLVCRPADTSTAWTS